METLRREPDEEACATRPTAADLRTMAALEHAAAHGARVVLLEGGSRFLRSALLLELARRVDATRTPLRLWADESHPRLSLLDEVLAASRRPASAAPADELARLFEEWALEKRPGIVLLDDAQRFPADALRQLIDRVERAESPITVVLAVPERETVMPVLRGGSSFVDLVRLEDDAFEPTRRPDAGSLPGPSSAAPLIKTSTTTAIEPPPRAPSPAPRPVPPPAVSRSEPTAVPPTPRPMPPTSMSPAEAPVPPPAAPTDLHADGLWTIEELMAEGPPVTGSPLTDAYSAPPGPEIRPESEPNAETELEIEIEVDLGMLASGTVAAAEASPPPNPSDEAEEAATEEAEEREANERGEKRPVETREGSPSASARRLISVDVDAARSSSDRGERPREEYPGRAVRRLDAWLAAIVLGLLVWLVVESPQLSLRSESSTADTPTTHASISPTVASPPRVAAAPPGGVRPSVALAMEERSARAGAALPDAPDAEIVDLRQALDVLAGDAGSEQREAAIRFLDRHGPDAEAYDYLEDLDQRRPGDAAGTRDVLMARSRLRRALCASWADDPRRETLTQLGCPDAR